jgi:P22 coat protein - gene protein 5
MANSILVNGIVEKTALPILRNKLPMAMNANKDYQDKISSEEARAGGTIFVKRPPKYIGRDGELMKVENTVETAVPMTLQIAGCDVSFSQKDLMLSMDDVARGGLDHVLEPAMTTIAAKIELAGTALFRQVATSIGTPGTPPTDPSIIATGNAYIDAAGGSIGSERYAVIDSFANASLASTLRPVFNPSEEISKAFMKGRMGNAYGFEFFTDPAIQSHTAGVYGGSPIVTVAGQNGNVLLTSGWTAGSILNAGDTFRIAGVFATNPQTRQSTGQLKFFVAAATAVADGGGLMTIFLGEQGLIPAATAYQNVTAAPAASAAITVTSGTTGQVSRQSLLYDKNAFTFACVPQSVENIKKGVIYAGNAEDKMSGISISLVQAYDIDTNQVKTRFDVLYAWLASYPELATRLQG